MQSSNLFLTALEALIFFLLANTLYEALYRIFWHPLRSIPGPWLNRLSELPATLALVTGEQHLYYHKLHERYGPVVRVSPNELSFISLSAREEIYGLRKNGLNMEKSPIFLGAVGNVDGYVGVSLALNQEHARQRRALGHIFTNSALLQEEVLVKSHITRFMDILDKAAVAGQALDFSSWFTYVAFDIMGELCFAEPFGCLEQASATDWSKSVINVFVAAAWTQGIRRLSGVNTWMESILTRLFIPRDASEWRKVHLSKAREKTMNRIAQGVGKHRDFVHQILANVSKGQLSETEIVLNIALFISAGTDTTATVLTGWAYFVCTHPQVKKRLLAEIRGNLKSRHDLTWTKVKELHYLDATILETLRLFPPSAASQQRIVPPGGAVIENVFVPAGTTVAVSPWASTRSTTNFRDPNLFRPERWLRDKRYEGDNLGVSLPFGSGPRVCLGRNLAFMELRLISSHLLWDFDINLDLKLHLAENITWGLDGIMQPMKVFHSMTKPPLWLTISRAQT